MTSDWAREQAERLAEEVTWQVNPITGPSAEVFNVVRSAIATALLEAEQRILDRLKEPDEALMQVLAQKIGGLVEFDTNADEAADILRTLAAELAKGGDDDK